MRIGTQDRRSPELRLPLGPHIVGRIVESLVEGIAGGQEGAAFDTSPQVIRAKLIDVEVLILRLSDCRRAGARRLKPAS